jgi:Xaa-Pro dipeptidase
MNLSEIQSALRSQQLSGWLIYDFRGSNPILAALIPGKRSSSRRVYLWIPESGEPALILHTIDLVTFRDVKLPIVEYRSWQQMQQILRNLLGRTIAMEYSPMGELPAVSYADAGTLEFVRSIGVDVVSSADMIQLTIARWSDDAQREHRRASEGTAAAMRGAFDLIRSSRKSNQSLNERQVQQFILDHFRRSGLETMDAPIVAVNAHAGDPHFEVSTSNSSPIVPGDWVLIDLWARVPGDQNVYSDITWVGFCGSDVSPRHQRAWEVTKAARDACLKLAIDSWRFKTSVQGWQLDDVARDVFIAAGYESNIRHRTGHSLSPGPKVHGMGMNLDNLETRETRVMLPAIGFTIEPAIYFEDFGVRSEINVFVDPSQGPVVRGPIQNEIERL